MTVHSPLGTAQPRTPEGAPAPSAAAAGPNPAATPRWQMRVAVALVLLHGVLAWVARAFAVNTHDEANYILLARALRGFRYVDTFLLGSPPHAHYPPAYPAFLALLSLPFGEHVGLYIAANVLASMASLALLYDVMRRRVGDGPALSALALGALNPSVTQFAGMPLSEVPYMFLSVVALWAVLREPAATDEARSRRWFWPVLAGGAAIGAALTRSAGVTILGALFVYWLFGRYYRRSAVLLAVGTALVGSWLLWIVLAPHRIVGQSYTSDLTYTPNPQRGLIRALLDRIVDNAASYPTRNLPSVLPQPAVPGTKIDNLVGILILLVVAVAGTMVLWKRARIVVVYLAAYAALLAIWTWNESRLLIPILPAVLCLIMAGAFRVGAMGRWLRPTPIVIAGIVAVTAAFQQSSMIRAGLACDRAHATTSPTCFPEQTRGYFAAMRYVRDSLPPDAVIFTSDDALTGYYGERPTVFATTFPARDPVAMETGLRALGVRYMLLSPLRPPHALHVSQWLERCADVSLVKEFPATTLLLSLPLAAEPPPAHNACADIDRYSKSAVNAALWPGPGGVEPP